MNHKPWKLEELVELAKQCKTRKEFRTKHSGAYGAAIDMGKLDEVCCHLPSQKGKGYRHHYWTTEDLVKVANSCKSRGEFYKKHKRAYHAAYNSGNLDLVCAGLPPSRKKNKFVRSFPNHSAVLGPAFLCQDVKEFRERYGTAYTAGLRFGIDFQELFENLDNASYIKNLIKSLYENALQDKLHLERPTRGDIVYNHVEDRRIVVEEAGVK